MKRYIAGLAALLMLGIYGCSGGGGTTTTALDSGQAKTASVTITADFGGSEVQSAFYNDIDNITITYSAGCTDTQNSFEYYFVDNRTSELLTSGYFFLTQFYESLYDLWAQTKLAELDNKTIDTTAYYDPKWEWAPNQIHVKNCSVTGQEVLTKDNNTVTIKLPVGYAEFRADFMKAGYDKPIERTGTRGKLIEGDNTIKIATVRGTWNFTTPFVPQIQEAKDWGIISVDKLHITGGSIDYDFGTTLGNQLRYDTFPSNNFSTWNEWWIYNLREIASKYAGTNIYKTQGEPYRTAYYGGIYELKYIEDNGSQAVGAIGTLFNFAQGFTGGTSSTSNWNGFDDQGFEERELDNGKSYHFFILGYELDVDSNNTVTRMTKKPITTIDGDTMKGWIVETMGTTTGTYYLKTDSGWIKLNNTVNSSNIRTSKKKSAVISALSKVGKATLYPNQSTKFCINNVKSQWTDLEYQSGICYNTDNQTYRLTNYYSNDGTPQCYTGETPIKDAYIKGEFTDNIDKVCMTPFTATRASKFDLSNLVNTVEVVISKKK